MAGFGLAGALVAILLAIGDPQARRGERAPETAEAPEITPAERDRRNPVPPSAEALGAGRALWRAHCETCHGTAGKGDGPNARLHERRRVTPPGTSRIPISRRT